MLPRHDIKTKCKIVIMFVSVGTFRNGAHIINVIIMIFMVFVMWMWSSYSGLFMLMRQKICQMGSYVRIRIRIVRLKELKMINHVAIGFD